MQLEYEKMIILTREKHLFTLKETLHNDINFINGWFRIYKQIVHFFVGFIQEDKLLLCEIKVSSTSS